LAQTLPLLGEAGLRQRVLTTRALDETPIGALAGAPVTRHSYFYPEWPLSPERRALYDRRAGNLVSFALARHLYSLRDLALVHCHTGNRLGAQCLRVARRRNVPCVLTLHGGHFAVPGEERQRWGGASPVGKQASRAPVIPWGKALSWLWDTRNLIENVDAVICVGIEEYEAAKKSLERPKVVLLPGGVDIDVFQSGGRERGRRLLGVPEDAELVTCVARLDPQKDQETLVRAFLRLDRPQLHLALVGAETEPGYAARLRELAASAKGRLRIVDNLPSERIPDVLSAAEIAVLPSRHEPFGLSCLEAWAAGTCLVASSVGGPRWLLDGERAGRLFPVGDDEKLAALLQELLDDPAQRESLSKEGETRARSEFTWRRGAEGLLDLYESLGVRWERRRPSDGGGRGTESSRPSLRAVGSRRSFDVGGDS
jgi:glycosyltransferase involved in cell wall biosynthesis